jgi:integrase
LRSRDLVALRDSDIVTGDCVTDRAVIVQQKTGRPVQFELTEQTREAVHAWLVQRPMDASGYLFPSRVHDCSHLSTRQYARIVSRWVASIGLDPRKYGTHSLRRTKAALIYKKTGNLGAVQLLLGHTKIETTGGTSASRPMMRCESLNRLNSKALGRAAASPGTVASLA